MKTCLTSCFLLSALFLFGCSDRNPTQAKDVSVGSEGSTIDQAIPGKDSTGRDGVAPLVDGVVTQGDGPVTPPGDGPISPHDATITKCTSTAQCIPYACNISSGVCRTSCSSNSHCATAFSYYCNTASKCVKPPSCTTVNDPKCNGYDCNVSTGLCRLTCSTSSHCQNGYSCSAGACVKQVTCTTVNDPLCKTYKCNTSAGICRTSCTSSTNHCAAGAVCSGGVCVKTAACTTDAQCSGFRCNTTQKACYASCSCTWGGGSTCVTGLRCDPTGKKCVKPTACTNDNQCAGYDCSQGFCRTCCTNTYMHCRMNYTCQSNACVKP